MGVNLTLAAFRRREERPLSAEGISRADRKRDQRTPTWDPWPSWTAPEWGFAPRSVQRLQNAALPPNSPHAKAGNAGLAILGLSGFSRRHGVVRCHHG